MKKVLLVYASMSGNTKKVADLIEQGLLETGATVCKKDVSKFEESDFAEYDTIVIGTFTWGNGDLPKQMNHFYDLMNETDLSRKSFAVFGSGDTVFKHFCGAVDILEEKITEQNGRLLLRGLKMELRPVQDNDIARCIQFGVQIGEMLNKRESSPSL